MSTAAKVALIWVLILVVIILIIAGYFNLVIPF